MNLTDVAVRLNQLHREGERTRMIFNINPVGHISYEVQRITGGKVHTGCSLVDPGDALIEANDSIATADVACEYESKLRR